MKEKKLTDKEIENRYDLRSLLVKEEGVFRLDFASQENRAAVLLTKSTKDARLFIENKDIHAIKAKELFPSATDEEIQNKYRNIAKVINLGLNYGMGKYLLAAKLGLPIDESNRLREEYWRLNPKLREFKYKLSKQDIITTPLYNRILKLGKNHTRLNWVIQGFCAELLWEALRYLNGKKDEVKILPHFHDELVLKCLLCTSHTDEACKPILKLKAEIENLYPFYWEGTNVKVFRLEVK